MNDTERPDDRSARDRLQRARAVHREPRVVTQPLSARAAAAQFDLAAILQPPPQERALSTPETRARTDLTIRPQDNGRETMADTAASESGREAGRLPSAWYKQADEIAAATRKERMALAVRGAAALCLATGAAFCSGSALSAAAP